MQRPPDAALRPAPKAPPTGGATAAPHLGREQLPGQAGAEDDAGARQHGPVGNARAAAPSPRRTFTRQQRRHAGPEYIRP